jgi:hypothetical protein
MMEKYVFFAFKGEIMCFIHVLLNALDMDSRGADVKIVMEGEAVALIEKMDNGENPLYLKARGRGLIDGVCKACSAKMGVLSYNETSGIPLLGDMSGHPSMGAYIRQGYTLITM